jgi:uncharacterized membrane protein
MNALLSNLLPIHVAAGALAMVLGTVALSTKKGATIHLRSGLLFVYAMLVMGFSASMLGNVLGGLMPVYFVTTALTTVRPASPSTRYINVAALGVAIGFALVSVVAAVVTFTIPGRVLEGVPFFMHFFLATIMILAAIGDVRILRFGVPRGGPRLTRHLWRMCFALFIAAGSFFSIRERVAKLLPDPLTTWPMRMLPIVLVFVAMFYWLWRVRSRRAVRVTGRVRCERGLGDFRTF